MKVKPFEWSKTKNEWLKRKRGISLKQYFEAERQLKNI